MNPGNPLFGLIQTIIVMVLVFILAYKYIDLRTKNSHFVCPCCGTSFKLSKAAFCLSFQDRIKRTNCYLSRMWLQRQDAYCKGLV